MEVGHIIEGIPQAELDKRKDGNASAAVSGVCEAQPCQLAVEPERNKGSLRSPYTRSFSGDGGVTEAMPALVVVQFSPDRHEARRPKRLPVADVEVAAAAVERNVVVPIPGDSPEPGVLVKAIPSGSVGYKREEVFTAQVVDPRVGRGRCGDDVLPAFVIKAAKPHISSPPSARVILANLRIFCIVSAYSLAFLHISNQSLGLGPDVQPDSRTRGRGNIRLEVNSLLPRALVLD